MSTAFLYTLTVGNFSAEKKSGTVMLLEVSYIDTGSCYRSHGTQGLTYFKGSIYLLLCLCKCRSNEKAENLQSVTLRIRFKIPGIFCSFFALNKMSLFEAAAQAQAHLVEFNAGKCIREGNLIKPDLRKG